MQEKPFNSIRVKPTNKKKDWNVIQRSNKLHTIQTFLGQLELISLPVTTPNPNGRLTVTHPKAMPYYMDSSTDVYNILYESILLNVFITPRSYMHTAKTCTLNQIQYTHCI